MVVKLDQILMFKTSSLIKINKELVGIFFEDDLFVEEFSFSLGVLHYDPVSFILGNEVVFQRIRRVVYFWLKHWNIILNFMRYDNIC